LSALSVSSRLLAVYKKSVIEQTFLHEFAFDNNCLKHSTNFESVENVRSSNVVEFEFELRHISSLLSLSYYANEPQHLFIVTEKHLILLRNVCS